MLESTTIELVLWLISMFAVAWVSWRFSKKLATRQEETAAIPKVNSEAGSKMFAIIGMNYFVVAVGCVLLYFVSPAVVVNQLMGLLNTWWLIEVFLFFNIITFHSIWVAKSKIIVNL
jgi:hypothetical protein